MMSSGISLFLIMAQSCRARHLLARTVGWVRMALRDVTDLRHILSQAKKSEEKDASA